MREHLRQYADDAFDIIKYAANEIGQRVPGTDGEKKFHDYMSDKLSDLGLTPKTEKFIFAPRGSIGGLPYAGWGGVIIAVLAVLGVIAFSLSSVAGIAVSLFAAVYALGLWTWLIVSVFKYNTFFDWCFKQEVSYNTYAELLPEDGQYDYTVMLSGHTDTSWTLKHSVIKSKLNPALIFIKLGVGAVSVALLTMIALTNFILVMLMCYGGKSLDAKAIFDAYTVMWQVTVYSAPALMIGSYLLTLYNEKNPRVASPGAMDNASGIAIAYEVIKYFKENPDKMPARCRFVDVNCGAEESGLRGSMAFVRAHKDDGMLDHAYHINVDSIADKDYFEVIHGDAWLCPHFDRDMERMFFEAMKEAGIEKPGDMANPVGGCDSTPFMRAGVKTITFAAQNPTMTNYYHTLYDVPERFEVDTVGLGLDVVLRVIDKIAEFEEAKK